MYAAVIFDFFGTLTRAVQRGPDHQRIAQRLGCHPEDFARELNATFASRSVGGLGDPATALGQVAARLGAYPSQRRLRRVVTERTAAVAADTRLRPGSIYVLRSLRRRGVRVGLISDCGPELPEILPALPVAPLLDATVLSIETGLHKPDPRIYDEACRRLRVEPHKCLYIGDGGSHELTGATSVGMTAVRLAAPDLAGHLVFDRDAEWGGRSVESLYDVLEIAGPPALATRAHAAASQAAGRTGTNVARRKSAAAAPGRTATPSGPAG